MIIIISLFINPPVGIVAFVVASIGTTKMEDTTKFISLLLLVFPLFTKATHGGE